MAYCVHCEGDGEYKVCAKCDRCWVKNANFCPDCGNQTTKMKECKYCPEEKSDDDDYDPYEAYNDGRGVDWDNDLHSHWRD